MKLPKKARLLIDELLNQCNLTPGEKKFIKSYDESHRLFILMLSPYVPLIVRKQAVVIYGTFINPSYKLPNSFVLKFLDSFDISTAEYLNTLCSISNTKLILY